MGKYLSEYGTRLTGSKFRPNLQRSQVDQGQTSFEENKQFSFCDEFHPNASTPPIDKTHTLVYKVEAVRPINLTNLYIELWSGGRNVQIFEDTVENTITFNGVLIVTDKIVNTNRNLNEYIQTLPQSQVVVSRYIGTETFTSVLDAVDATAIRTSGVNNQQTATYAESGQRAGYAAGDSFYIVLKQIDLNNDDSHGILRINWEEIFED